MFDPMLFGALLALVTSAVILGGFALACACISYLDDSRRTLARVPRRGGGRGSEARGHDDVRGGV